MYLRIAIAALVATALAATHWKAYHAGSAAVQGEWDRDIAVRTKQALMAEQEARRREHSLATQKRKVEDQYADDKRKAAIAAGNARVELSGLRNELYAIPAPSASTNTTAITRVDGTTIERQLLGQCATALVGVAEDADRLAATVLGLQNYVENVCLVSK
jgi:hypothetical protein